MPGAPRRSRRASTQPPLVLGFAGSGELSQKATVALLDDLIENRTVQMVILPLTKDDTTDEIIHVQRWCVEKEIPYEVVSNEDEVAKDKALKKILEGAAGDYAVSEQGAGRDIVELLTPEDDKDETEYQLLMFMDVEVEEDITVFEHTEEHEVQSFDLRDNLSPLTHEDGEPEPEPEPEPVDEVGARRGRRRAAEPVDPENTAEANGYTTAEQKEYDKLISKDYTLVELKKMVKALDSDLTTEDLKGTDKAYVADLIIVTKRNKADEAVDEAPDEAQNTAPVRRRGRAAAAEEPTEPSGDEDDAEDPKEAVFARLRGSREAAERIAAGMSAVAREKLNLPADAEDVEVAAGLLAGALMAFAEYIVVEVRKPKSAGRPRKDGTEAQPKPPVDPDAPKRGRGRPRKATAE